MSKFTSITAEQIERFFESRCTPEEAEAVSEYLQENPDVFQYYVQREWREAATGADLSTDDSRALFKEIKGQLAGKDRVLRSGKLVKMRWAMAGIAAAVVLLVSGVWWWLPSTRQPVAKVAPTVQTVPAKTKPGPQLRVIHSVREENLHLPDGSTVVLYANSTLRYTDPFEPQRRALSLEGKALFSVAKDEARPFIVRTGTVETTVLGTEFLVTESPGSVLVRLFSGKVRLHASDRKWNKDLVLEPGEQLDYVKKNALAVVSRWEEKETAEEEPQVTEPVEEQELVFDNEPLSHVLDKLAASYHLAIRYNQQQIGNLYFTGSVLTSEPLTTTLHVIASMNELKIVPGKKGYTIRK